MVAFNFYVSSLLPQLPYNTFIETMIIGGYGVIFLAIIAIVVEHRSRQNDMVFADRFLSVCRWLFPFGSVGTAVLMTLAFLR